MKHENIFISESNFGYDSPYLPFIIKARVGSELYEDSIWAIKILNVISDGQVIVGKPSFQFLDDLNLRSRKLSGEFYVYKFKTDDLVIGSLSSDGEYSLVEYLIPNDANELEISYQHISPGGEVEDQIYKLKATRY